MHSQSVKHMSSLYKVLAIGLFVAHTNADGRAPIINPGAPGQPGRTLSAEQATQLANTSYSRDDIRFVQDMIPHHGQALEMAALVADRTNRSELIDIAGRINSSQADEIEFMEDWLAERNGVQQSSHGHHGHAHRSHAEMGMATPEQMAALAASEGADFDRLFLTLMIRHHEGAVDMVDDLLDQPGSAYDPILFEFTSDITNDQTAEIERMSALLATLSTDPRVGLGAGFDDAEQVLLNLQLVASLPKPVGFFDPQNPAGLPPEKPDEKNADSTAAAASDSTHLHVAAADSAGADSTAKKGKDKKSRSPLLSFSNTDMAFDGDVLAVGSYHGFNLYKLEKDGTPKLISSIVCPGGQGDVSIVGDLLLMSVEQTRGRIDCGLEGVDQDVSQERFRGLRIFDISNLKKPKQVGAVQTCRGSHTHSVVSGPEPDGKLIVYNSGTSSIRDEEELAGCVDGTPGDDRTALFRIDIIEIPVEDPSQARIVASPAVFADPETGNLAGLWRGGDHGDDTQKTRRTDQCHDITVFPERNIAAGACSGNGILFDISDPLNPQRMDATVDAGFAYWHSATFNNDGTKVIFTDEWGGGSRPRCRAHDPLDWGADAIYDIVDGQLEFRSYFKMPAPQTEEENCVAHNGSIVPVPGRDLFVQSWYQGGLSLVDFTDSANPVEIGYFDRGPIDEETLVTGGFWSSYWYGGRIYATEIVRGLDVLALATSEHMSQAEIDAAHLAEYSKGFNPQQQFAITWPDEPTVAQAYVDQLGRSQALSSETIGALTDALQRAEKRLGKWRKRDRALADELAGLAQALADGDGSAQHGQLTLLLDQLAARLR